MTKRELLNDLGYDGCIIFENPDYDAAIVGISEDNRVVYDFDKMVLSLIEEDGMDEESAADFIYYNTIRSLPYAVNGAPIVMYSF